MFESEIEELVGAIRAAVTAYKKAGPVSMRRRVRILRPDFTLQYADHFDFGNFLPERIEENVWDWNDQERFEAAVIKTLPAYKSLVAKLESRGGLIDSFVRTTCLACFQGIGHDDIAKRITTFARELTGRPLRVKITAFLDGLSIAESSVAISETILLRQPTVKDMSQEVILDEYGGLSFPLSETWFRVIGEFSFDVPNTGIAQTKFLRLVQALRLFRVGGVVARRYLAASEHSFSQGRNSILAQPGPRSRFSYSIARSDAHDASEFLQEVAPLLPDPLDPDKGIAPREIALTRYKDTLFHGGPVEQVVTFAITSLEALFLRNESELTRRLAQRVAVFLRILGSHLNAQETHKNVTEGYQIRSKFIHGETIKNRSRGEGLVPLLVDYARLCTLVCFQMTLKKEELIEQLDAAMIDPARTNDVVASLAPVRYR